MCYSPTFQCETHAATDTTALDTLGTRKELRAGLQGRRCALLLSAGHEVLEPHKALLPVGHPDVREIFLIGSVYAQHHDVS